MMKEDKKSEWESEKERENITDFHSTFRDDEKLHVIDLQTSCNKQCNDASSEKRIDPISYAKVSAST
jgi:hypothetical protein